MSKASMTNNKGDQDPKRKNSNNSTPTGLDCGKRKVQVSTKEVSAKKFKELEPLNVIQVEHW